MHTNATVGNDVNYTYVVGDDYQRHRWQCTTSLVPQLQLYPVGHIIGNVTVLENRQISLPHFVCGGKQRQYFDVKFN